MSEESFNWSQSSSESPEILDQNSGPESGISKACLQCDCHKFEKKLLWFEKTEAYLKITLNIDDNEKDPNDYFDDGVRKIDFILVWTQGKPEFTAFDNNLN